MRLYQYFLTNSAGQSLTINEDHVMVPSNRPVQIKHAPDGWQTSMVQFKRSAKYAGLLKSFTIPMRFVKDAATILRTIMYTEGYESIVYLIILKFDPQSNTYRSWYKGEIDLAKMVDERDYVEVNVREGGTAKLLSANEGKTYEFPLDETAELLIIDGPALQQATTSQVNGFPDISKLGSHLPQISIVASEGDRVGTLVNDTEFHSVIEDTDNAAIAGTNDPVYSANTETILKIDYDYAFKTAYDTTVDGKLQDSDLRVKVDVRVFNAGALKSATTIYTSTADLGLILGPPTPHVAKVKHSIQGSITLALEAGDAVYFYHYGTPFHDPSIIFGGSLNIRYYYVDLDDLEFVPGTIRFAFDIVYAPSNARAFTAASLYSKLMNKVTEGVTAGEAPVLEVTGSGTITDPARSILILSGDSIRGIAGAVIKTSFSDFYTAMDVVKVVGMDIQNDIPRLDTRDPFYDGDVVYELGEVKKCEISLAEDKIYNLLKIGYPDQEYSDVNGRTEFNTIQEYGLPVSRIAKTVELISPYRADCYGIEFTRINLEGKSTTDSTSDNDVFMVDAYGVRDETGRMIWRPYRRPYASIDGVLTESVYNIELSPKRLLFKHAPWIRSLLYRRDNEEITFQSCEKNAELSTLRITINGEEVIAEKSNLAVKDMGSIKHLPFYATVTVSVPLNYLELMEISRAGRMGMYVNGVRLVGILEEGGIQPATMEEQDLKFLLAPGNDLTKLIR